MGVPLASIRSEEIVFEIYEVISRREADSLVELVAMLCNVVVAQGDRGMSSDKANGFDRIEMGM